jgi:hypothetical protein
MDNSFAASIRQLKSQAHEYFGDRTVLAIDPVTLILGRNT